MPDECEYRVDVDGDGLTTLADQAALISHLTGPATSTATGCDQLYDADHDGDIDLSDFAFLQRVFVGSIPKP